MAEIEPLRALRYDIERTGGLQPVVSPPYDVIDAADRARLLAGSPYNVVEIDLPQPGQGDDPDPYAHAARTLAAWQEDRIVVRDDTPAVWTIDQAYVGPDGRARTRRGFLARLRITDYGPGKVRPHERTHPGPKEDRLRLTRATQANLSPIFALYSDPGGLAREALRASTDGTPPFGEATDADGTVNRIWRIADPATIEQLQEALAPQELLIADGHHRYETARVYAEEVGVHDGPHRYVLVCFVALEDPGLTVFPTHRLVRGLSDAQRVALENALSVEFSLDTLQSSAELPPHPPAAGPVQFGHIDSTMIPHRLTLTEAGSGAVAAALPDRSDAYRTLDTAVLETLVLKGALGFSDDQIDELDGLGYARSDDEALALVAEHTYETAFFTAPVPVGKIQQIAAAGETMPPKSTFFYPKVPTGLLFNPLRD